MRLGGRAKLTTQDGDFAARNGAGRSGARNGVRPPADDELPPRLHRRRGRRHRPTHRRAASAIFLVPILILTAIVGAAAIGGTAAVKSGCSLASLRPLSIGSNSFVFADDGTLLGSIPSDKNRQPLQLSQMSPWLPKATVAIEDKRFYEHGGLDYRGIVRALLKDIETGSAAQGGSTITQQLVRNLYIGNDQRTIGRKLKEACLAVRLYDKWPRRKILATYLNQVYYGNHAFGVEAAAQTYFSKSARDLTLTQAALLAGLPQAPSVYDPLRRPSVALSRRNDVLRALFQAHYISFARLEAALPRPLGLKPGSIYKTIRQPYFFGYVEDQLVDHFGAEKVRGGGLRIKTTIDPRLQKAARDAMGGILRSKSDPAAALVAIDPRNGKIRAMEVDVPSGERLQFNLASQGHRQAGSAFKPFVLAAAVNAGISLDSTFSGPPSIIIPDRECYTDGEPWNPHNNADESGGTMNLFSATAGSVNTIFAQLVVKVGPEKVVEMAHKMGISSPLEPVCSITLGTQPVSPLEMTIGYSVFAARGIKRTAQALELVRDARGKQLYKAVGRGNRVLSQNDADLITQALQGVVTGGTGTGAALFDRPAAGKTGTAENFQDAWFCGFVPQLVTCVWVGYPHREIPLLGVEGYGEVFGGTIPASIWHNFMTAALQGVPPQSFASAYSSGTPIYGGYATTPYTPSPPPPAAPTTSSSAPPPPPPPPPPPVSTPQPAPPPPPVAPPPPPPVVPPPAPPPPPPPPPPEPQPQEGQ
jgi:penicillin-binding protein 1A